MRRVAVMINLDWPVSHHQQVVAGIQRFARECGRWECVINPFADLLLSNPKQRQRLDGVVARATPRLAKVAAAAGVPVVNVWLNSPVLSVPSVLHDAMEAGRMAANDLVMRGFKSFAFLGYAGVRGSQMQLAGFREVLSAKGFTCTECWMALHYDNNATNWQRFQDKIGRWIDGWSPPTGVLVAHDLPCRYLAEACRERKLEIPQAVALIGSCNELVVASAGNPSLSSIDFGYERIGHRAAALLDSLMDGSPAPTKPIYVVPAALVTRQSSDAFVVGDPMVAMALRFITEHVHTGVHVEQVAAHVATTRRTLARRFHSCLGRSIHESITQLRIDQVKRHLIESHAALKTVAAACGFRDAIHMCKVFQRIEGTSPSDYRTARTMRDK